MTRSKKIIFSILGLAIIFLITGVTVLSVQILRQKWIIYTNEEFAFQFRYPSALFNLTEFTEGNYSDNFSSALDIPDVVGKKKSIVWITSKLRGVYNEVEVGEYGKHSGDYGVYLIDKQETQGVFDRFVLKEKKAEEESKQYCRFQEVELGVSPEQCNIQRWKIERDTFLGEEAVLAEYVQSIDYGYVIILFPVRGIALTADLGSWNFNTTTPLAYTKKLVAKSFKFIHTR